IWDQEQQNRELFEHVRKLIHLRREHPLLANDGELRFVLSGSDDSCLVYTKSDVSKTVVVVLNTSNKAVNYTVPVNISGKTVVNLWND
ncbi:alpha-glucosidase C-terminal domain-containing protein, partial [Alkalibacillus haloalkaliphilus]|uniref:alpha-glucosidase C-terminal domain-containing protein n=1 Tax=Alkalibacillus haloalkaliphilus TaxID=94136 RepID=UPI0029359A93